MRLFYEVFYFRLLEKSKLYIKLLKYKLNNFPKISKIYLNNNFFPVYRKYLICLEKLFIVKLEITKKKLENYFGNTLDKHTIRIYRNQEEYLTTLWQEKIDG